MTFKLGKTIRDYCYRCGDRADIYPFNEHKPLEFCVFKHIPKQKKYICFKCIENLYQELKEN